jgi:hypothetical protein
MLDWHWFFGEEMIKIQAESSRFLTILSLFLGQKRTLTSSNRGFGLVANKNASYRVNGKVWLEVVRWLGIQINTIMA